MYISDLSFPSTHYYITLVSFLSFFFASKPKEETFKNPLQ